MLVVNESILIVSNIAMDELWSLLALLLSWIIQSGSSCGYLINPGSIGMEGMRFLVTQPSRMVVFFAHKAFNSSSNLFCVSSIWFCRFLITSLRCNCSSETSSNTMLFVIFFVVTMWVYKCLFNLEWVLKCLC